ncbi:MAG: NTP transferase domain-containing protein [Candidatus Delongbacteria bacterium]|nr:NTP transferase domain-containing protein [Candidatus Delongbacteria bacterium]MCG2761026.1 NTP transferase domain-containing protein [Candidatus Delongbacteria bacterium]
MKKLITLILAAGKGKRMKSDLPKVIHKINGRELVKYVIDQAKETGSDEIWLITGHKSELVREATRELGVNYVEQKEQLGTGHAVLQAEEKLKGKSGDVLILCGDVPLLKPSTLKKFRELHNSSNSVATVMTTEFDDPFGYGRIIKDLSGNIIRIVEQKDANEEEKAIKEINSGVYIIDKSELFDSLKHISSDNASREYYLTDVIGILTMQNKKVKTYLIKDNTEILGINTVEQLKLAESIIKSRN